MKITKTETSFIIEENAKKFEVPTASNHIIHNGETLYSTEITWLETGVAQATLDIIPRLANEKLQLKK